MFDPSEIDLPKQWHKQVKFTLEQAVKAQWGAEVSLYSSFNLGDRWGSWLTPGSGCFTPGKKSRYPLYRSLGGLQGQSGRVRKISATPGFDPRTIQPVACRYADYAIPPHPKQCLTFHKSEQWFICQHVWSWVHNSYLRLIVHISSTYNENNARPSNRPAIRTQI